MHLHEPTIGLPDFKIISTKGTKVIEISMEYTGDHCCIRCGSVNLRKKESYDRRLRHHCIGIQKSVLLMRTHKFYFRDCGKYFNQRIPGVQPYQRVTELFKDQVAMENHNGVSKKTVGGYKGVGSATVERYYRHYLKLQSHESNNAHCPKVLGLDEKHFTKKKGYITTFADLKRHKVYDVALGRSEKSLEGYLKSIPGKDNCKFIMDLADTYRRIAKKHFPNAMIVADRFHVVKLINHHFLKTWAQLDDEGRKSRGLLSLMRRHEWSEMKDSSRENLQRYLDEVPVMRSVYEFKQDLMRLILARAYSKDQAKPLIREFLDKIRALKESNFRNLVTLRERWKIGWRR